MAINAHGPLTPRTVEELEGFRYEIDQVYPRLTNLAPHKPIIVAEFGCEIHHPEVAASAWAQGALRDLFSGRWPAIMGFSWWNASWENDDVATNNSASVSCTTRPRARCFAAPLPKHRNRNQETRLVQGKH